MRRFQCRRVGYPEIMDSGSETPAGADLLSFLREAREHMDGLLDRYGNATDSEEAGLVVKVAIRDLSRLDNAREEVVRQCLRNMPDDRGHLDRVDRARRERVAVLGELDAATEEVRTLDVHTSDAASIRNLMADLHTKLDSYHRYEAGELVSFLEAELDQDQLRELGASAWTASKRGPTHVHASKKPADERSRVGKTWTAIGDRLRDKEGMFGAQDPPLDATGKSDLAPEHPLAHHQGD